MEIFSYFFKNPLQILSFTANLFDFTTREDQDPPLQWMGGYARNTSSFKKEKTRRWEEYKEETIFSTGVWLKRKRARKNYSWRRIAQNARLFEKEKNA